MNPTYKSSLYATMGQWALGIRLVLIAVILAVELV